MSTITLTAESQNFTNAFFRFTGAGNAMQDDDTWNDGTTANSATKAFTVPTTYSATPYTFTVSVKEGSASGNVVATDTLTVASVKPGSDGDDGTDALTVILTNEAHAIPVDKNGTATFTGSGTTIRLFEGDTELDYDDQELQMDAGLSQILQTRT